MKFTKMHGNGNDFIVLDQRKKSLNLNFEEFALKYNSRHFGIGADQLIVINQSNSKENHCHMLIYNLDGSQVENCGNALRCVAKFLEDDGILSPWKIETQNHCNQINKFNELYSVDMGKYSLDYKDIHIDEKQLQLHTKGQFIEFDDNIKISFNDISFVSIGNPHCCLFLANNQITDELVHSWGPIIEKHPIFKNSTNVEFLSIDKDNQLSMRVWERGSDETLCCGTGACACAVTSIIKKGFLVNEPILVHCLGGDLTITIDHNNYVTMNGPAETIYRGVIE